MQLSFLNLPTSILLLITSHTSFVFADNQSIDEIEIQAQWPYNLPSHVKYWPEDPPGRRRDLEAIEEHVKLGRSPVGVQKMGVDEGEKFFMEYWVFEEGLDVLGERNSESESLSGRDLEEEEDRSTVNSSSLRSLRAPFKMHTEDVDILGYGELRMRAEGAADALARLQKRGFTCPTGTTNCSAVGYPNSCCTNGETCFVIQDTGLGPVGCCPNGETCGGSVSACAAPNTACADDLGGGCCIPNYVCAGVGCELVPHSIYAMLLSFLLGILASTAVVTVTETITESSSSTTQTTTVIVVSTLSSSTTTSTHTDPQTTLTCSSDFQTCPASLGGGCCPSSRSCALSSCAPTSTSISSSTTTSTSTTTTTVST